jgi:hypothetical protein
MLNQLAANSAERYQALIEAGDLDRADLFLIENIDQLGYAKAVWHLWRFHRFEALSSLRSKLFVRFEAGTELSREQLELLYYLQENARIGTPADVHLMCPEIFRALCSVIARDRNVAIANNLVWQGLIEESDDLGLPTMDDPDVLTRFGSLDHFDRSLLEAARINRCVNQPVAFERQSGTIQTTRVIERRRAIELFLGPYYFTPLSEDQKVRAKLPKEFRSPFRDGLNIVIDFLLERGCQIVPFLCWRGGIIPPRSVGIYSLSYHTIGSEPGRLHYKFTHFSDLMQIDPCGYAGFANFATRSADDVLRETADLTEADIETIVAGYRSKYIERRISWRTQSAPQDLSSLRGRRTFFMPLQDPLDEVSNLRFLSIEEFVLGALDGLSTDDCLFIKKHPVDATMATGKLLSSVKDDPRVILTDAPIYDLFRVSDAVVTLNSGVGFEALLAGLPVVAAGKSDYNLAAKTVESREALTRAIRDSDYGPDPRWRSRVVAHYFKSFALDPLQPADFRQKLEKILFVITNQQDQNVVA